MALRDLDGADVVVAVFAAFVLFVMVLAGRSWYLDYKAYPAMVECRMRGFTADRIPFETDVLCLPLPVQTNVIRIVPVYPGMP